MSGALDSNWSKLTRWLAADSFLLRGLGSRMEALLIVMVLGVGVAEFSDAFLFKQHMERKRSWYRVHAESFHIRDAILQCLEGSSGDIHKCNTLEKVGSSLSQGQKLRADALSSPNMTMSLNPATGALHIAGDGSIDRCEAVLKPVQLDGGTYNWTGETVGGTISNLVFPFLHRTCTSKHTGIKKGEMVDRLKGARSPNSSKG